MEKNEPLIYEFYKYPDILELQGPLQHIVLGDHLLGFDKHGRNIYLDHLQNIAQNTITVYHDQVTPNLVRQQYPELDFKFKLFEPIWKAFEDYNIHPEINYKNFVCSFNGTAHVSRKLLAAILNKFGWFDPDYSSKNFTCTVPEIEGHVYDYVGEDSRFYNKFFIDSENFDFFQNKYSFGHSRFIHSKNIYNLQNQLTQSFLHIVSETMATSYVPFVTEKFLYSVVTRGLFLSYAQPGWHAHLETHYGFKPYRKLFDYKFDNIQNPILRLVELMTMISKFSKLSTSDWNDLYLLEQDTVEYNYDHYFSQDYLKCLAKYS